MCNSPRPGAYFVEVLVDDVMNCVIRSTSSWFRHLSRRARCRTGPDATRVKLVFPSRAAGASLRAAPQFDILLQNGARGTTRPAAIAVRASMRGGFGNRNAGLRPGALVTRDHARRRLTLRGRLDDPSVGSPNRECCS